MEALCGVTGNVAYQYFEDSKREYHTGKTGEFCHPGSDPLMVPLRQIKDIQVLHTIKDGEILYSKGNP